MKKQRPPSKKITKGTSTGLLLSLAIHAALFFLAGLLVVFTVVKQKETEFEPPKAVERPKMKLKKPKVRVKKSSKPKSTTRIVTQSRRVMPDIALPEMSGLGDGLGDGLDTGFDLLPNIEETEIFGAGQSIGNDFVGSFYDLKRDREGRPIPMTPEAYADELTRFVRGGWNPSDLGNYYRSPRKLYATCFMMGTIMSTLGPKSFGEDTGGWCWMAHYKGELVYPEDIKFRFWGMGNDLMLVRVGGKLVLNGNWHKDGLNMYITDIGGNWQSSSGDDSRYWYGRNKARVGDWIELKAGEPVEMELMIGEPAGGFFSAMLAVQVEGVEYERNRQGGPILPMFKTAEPSRKLQDAIFRELIVNEASVTNGPVFRDYIPVPHINRPEKAVQMVQSGAGVETQSKKSVWTMADGKQIEGDFVALMANKVVLKTSRGEQLKIPLSSLSPADFEYIELNNPPKFSIDFIKLSDNKLARYEQSPSEIKWGRPPPRVNDFTFGAKVKQQGIGSYSQELTVEYFSIGKERAGNRYILLERKSSSFVPAEENDGSHRFMGSPIEFVEYYVDGDLRGMKPLCNLVTITDERGQVIQFSTSRSWLWENIENLKRLPVGAYMDETCRRTYPTAPKPVMW